MRFPWSQTTVAFVSFDRHLPNRASSAEIKAAAAEIFTTLILLFLGPMRPNAAAVVTDYGGISFI